ncbi:glycosyltransferase [Omnitrophica bacterium]|nr:glycosyltransferase [Candidatus Omnitrophota bacterium]
MKGEVELSIITPVFNGVRFLEFAINNFIQQNCPAAEHIIIDGGSTDGSLEVIKRYANKYSHLRWLSEKDSGQSDAMNKGIRMARGRIVSFLNADDFYEPNVFNRALRIFQGLPEPSFVAGNCNIWADENCLTGVCRPTHLKLEDLLMGYSFHPHPVNPTSYFYHKSLHEKAGMYREDLHLAMDQEFIFRAVQHADCLYVNEIWGNYRCLKGTKTRDDIDSGEIIVRDRRFLCESRKQLSLGGKINLYAKIFKEVLIKGFLFNGRPIIKSILGQKRVMEIKRFFKKRLR